jgi:hypothetical protein
MDELLHRVDIVIYLRLRPIERGPYSDELESVEPTVLRVSGRHSTCYTQWDFLWRALPPPQSIAATVPEERYPRVCHVDKRTIMRLDRESYVSLDHVVRPDQGPVGAAERTNDPAETFSRDLSATDEEVNAKARWRRSDKFGGTFAHHADVAYGRQLAIQISHGRFRGDRLSGEIRERLHPSRFSQARFSGERGGKGPHQCALRTCAHGE